MNPKKKNGRWSWFDVIWTELVQSTNKTKRLEQTPEDTAPAIHGTKKQAGSVTNQICANHLRPCRILVSATTTCTFLHFVKCDGVWTSEVWQAERVGNSPRTQIPLEFTTLNSKFVALVSLHCEQVVMFNFALCPFYNSASLGDRARPTWVLKS
jgi:hypothetical protein